MTEEGKRKKMNVVRKSKPQKGKENYLNREEQVKEITGRGGNIFLLFKERLHTKCRRKVFIQKKFEGNQRKGDEAEKLK